VEEGFSFAGWFFGTSLGAGLVAYVLSKPYTCVTERVGPPVDLGLGLAPAYARWTSCTNLLGVDTLTSSAMAGGIATVIGLVCGGIALLIKEGKRSS
jgi:hypothetical protein